MLFSDSLGRKDPIKRETQISKVLGGTEVFLLPYVPLEQFKVRVSKSRKAVSILHSQS